MKRLSVPLEDNQHLEIKVKAAVTGLPQAVIARRLLLGWLNGDIVLPIYSGDVLDGGRVVKMGWMNGDSERKKR